MMARSFPSYGSEFWTIMESNKKGLKRVDIHFLRSKQTYWEGSKTCNAIQRCYYYGHYCKHFERMGGKNLFQGVLK
jgi:hypothetical protein